MSAVLECSDVTTDHIRLELDHVGKAYGGRRVLRSICADLATGDRLAVTGRNGAGKSTLLRVIAGLMRPSEGAVRFSINGTTIPVGHRRSILGFVGPDLQVYRELTAREHLDFVVRLRGLRNAEPSEVVLERMGLAGRGDEPVSGFSSGMVQRLRYALALVHRPRVLLLDEPTTNLDEAGIVLVGQVIEHMAADGIVVIATNDPRDLRWGDLELALDAAGYD